jgi:pyridoxal phosphate enzyme (YggS family)
LSGPLSDRWTALQAALPATARLLAVSKGHPAAAIRELAGSGQRAFGESRLQEALPKQEQLADLALQWHFIGRLQSNKVRSVVRAFPVIHSVDSLPLAQRVSRIAGEEEKRPEVLLQVKLRPDANKGGFLRDELLSAWTELAALPSMTVVGLMTMAPMGCDADDRRALFEECRALADQLELRECSMGMSGDWQEAAAAGSTWLRLGSVLFGPRPSAPPQAG